MHMHPDFCSSSSFAHTVADISLDADGCSSCEALCAGGFTAAAAGRTCALAIRTQVRTISADAVKQLQPGMLPIFHSFRLLHDDPTRNIL